MKKLKNFLSRHWGRKGESSEELPFFSIVIPMFNEEKYITGILKDLKRQNFSDFEVILVDNNSTDDTAKVATEFLNTFGLEWKIIECKRQGIAAARNKGAEVAKADWLIFFDADIRLASNWCKIAYRKVTSNENIIALNGFLVISAPNRLKWLYYNSYTLISYATLRILNIFTGKAHIAGNNMVIQKEWFTKAGMFPHQICEDFAFSKNLYKIIDNPRIQTRISFKMKGSWHSRRFEQKGFLKSIFQWWYHAFKYKDETDYDTYR